MPSATFFNLPDDKRQRILDCALEEFARNDFDSASISQIVAQAGIAKGSLYQYFEDKRDLYLYLVQLAGEEKRTFLSSRPPPDPGMDVFAFLHWLIKEGARFELSNPLLARVAYRALFSDRPFGDAPFGELRKVAASYYESLVAMGVAQGAIDPGIDRGLAVFLFSAVFNDFGRYLLERAQVDPQALASGAVNYQRLAVEDQADELIGILKRGLAPAHARESDVTGQELKSRL